MNCTHCGKPLREGSTFCTSCGEKNEDLETREDVPRFSPSDKVYSATPVSIPLSKVILSALLGIAILICVIALSVLVVVRPEKIGGALAKTDVSGVIDAMGLSDEIANNVDFGQFGVRRVDADSINSFLKRRNVRLEASKVLDGYIAAIMEGDFDYYLSSRDVVNFVKAISADIYDEFDITLTNDDYDEIANSLTRERLREYSAGKLLAQTDVDFAAPYVLLSAYPLIIAVIICALLIADIFILLREKFELAFVFVGVPVAISGLIFIIAGLLMGPFTGTLGSGSLYGAAILAGGFSDATLVCGLVCLGVCIVCLAANIVLKNFLNNIRRGRNPAGSASKIWFYTGLAVNVAAFMLCAIFAVLCLRNMPESSQRDRYTRSAVSQEF